MVTVIPFIQVPPRSFMTLKRSIGEKAWREISLNSWRSVRIANRLRPNTLSLGVTLWKLIFQHGSGSINMDFFVGLWKTTKLHDCVCVIVDRMTKYNHFIPVKSIYKDEYYVKLYIDDIARWHGISLSIILDLGAQFTFHLWRSLQKGLGTQVNLSTAFHPHTDEQAECTIQTLEDMLWICIIDFKGSGDDHLLLIEFSYNNSYLSSIGMAPLEELYGRRCSSSVGLFEVGEFAFNNPKNLYTK